MTQTLELIDTAAAHQAASFHAYEVIHSTECGCFFCKETFSPQQITEWTDKGLTALCPHCHMDSVIPSTEAHPISQTTLKQMHRYAF